MSHPTDRIVEGNHRGAAGPWKTNMSEPGLQNPRCRASVNDPFEIVEMRNI